MRWLLPRWADFWSKFRPDGTMTWPAFEAFVRWEQKFSGDTRKVFEILEDSGGAHVSSRACLEARRHYEANLDLKHVGLEGLKRLLVGNHGSVVRAWRRLYDPTCSGKCCQAQFMRLSRSTGFLGDLKSTWAELTGSDAPRTITLGDLDQEIDRLLATFARALVVQYGSLREGWAWMLQHGYCGRLQLPEFIEICARLGFSHRDSKRLFTALDKDLMRTITQEEALPFVSHYVTNRNVVASSAELGSVTQACRASMLGAGNGGRGHGQAGYVDEASVAPFEFVLVLSEGEFQQYLQQRAALHAAAEHTEPTPDDSSVGGTSPQSRRRGPNSPRNAM